VRLDPEELRRLKQLAKRRKKDVSAVARELMDHGWTYLMLREYREGRLSLGTFSERVGLSLTEAIDLLAELGVRSPLEYDDYLRGYASAAKFLRGGSST
jgi:predicted transcriptional regulator